MLCGFCLASWLGNKMLRGEQAAYHAPQATVCCTSPPMLQTCVMVCILHANKCCIPKQMGLLMLDNGQGMLLYADWPSVDAYYYGSSSSHSIPNVEIPLLCIQVMYFHYSCSMHRRHAVTV